MPSFLYLLAGFVLLFFSGDWLVKSSVQFARHFKVSTLVIGVTVKDHHRWQLPQQPPKLSLLPYLVRFLFLPPHRLYRLYWP